MLFRSYDMAGYVFWVGMLRTNKKTRNDVLRDFAYSEEFRLLCLRYGVTQGSI